MTRSSRAVLARVVLLSALFAAIPTAWALAAPAQVAGPEVGAARPPTVAGFDARSLRVALNVAWVLMAAFLAMAMKAGFALVETGLIRSKNVAHTMAMNFGAFAIAILGFWATGFALMFGGHGAFSTFDGPAILDAMGSIRGLGRDWDVFGLKGFFLSGGAGEAGVLAMFVFHAVLVDAAATIPTGALAERWKFSAFVAFSIAATTLIYPIFGCWAWGKGWLADLGMNFGLGSGYVDFAGSGVVHLTGGVMAMAGAWWLGPRIGKYNADGSANAIPGHNVPMVALGTLILAFGWFGLNAGRSLEAADLRVASIAASTLLATGAGCLASLATTWIVFGRPDPTMGCNGLLAGAVAVSASCSFITPTGGAIIGAIAGVLAIGSILFVDKVLKVDDPVGAISVHGVCGAFGCLAVGLFATGEYGTGTNGVDAAPIGFFHGGGVNQLVAQIVGIAANLVWVGPASLLAFWIIERTVGNRVSARAEIEGLDVPEMGVLGYVDEDTYAVRTAGQDFLAAFGPGVPAKGASKPGPKEGKRSRRG